MLRNQIKLRQMNGLTLQKTVMKTMQNLTINSSARHALWDRYDSYDADVRNWTIHLSSVQLPYDKYFNQWTHMRYLRKT